MTQISRRGLITGLISLVAAPAIVRATSIMPVKVFTDKNVHVWSAWENTFILFEESILPNAEREYVGLAKVNRRELYVVSLGQSAYNGNWPFSCR